MFDTILKTIIFGSEADERMMLQVKLATTPADMERVYLLRHDVFVREMSVSTTDVDRWDAWSDHLMVQEVMTGKVVGCYRLLPGPRGEATGFYSETMFDLSPIRGWMAKSVELGRSCILPEYRNGKVIQLLWKGIADYMRNVKATRLFGCTSLFTEIHGISMQKLYGLLKGQQVIQTQPMIRPMFPSGITYDETTPEQVDLRIFLRQVPPLLKGYLQMGCRIYGEPAKSPDFDSYVLFTMLDLTQMDEQYVRHFFGVSNIREMELELQY